MATREYCRLAVTGGESVDCAWPIQSHSTREIIHTGSRYRMNTITLPHHLDTDFKKKCAVVPKMCSTITLPPFNAPRIFWQHVASTIRFVHAKFPLWPECEFVGSLNQRETDTWQGSTKSSTRLDLIQCWRRTREATMVVVLCIYCFEVIDNVVFVNDELCSIT